MKSVGIVINANEKLGSFIKNNLTSVFGDDLVYEIIYLETLERMIQNDIILVMTNEKILEVIPFVKDISRIIPISRTISTQGVEALRELSMQRILVVNDAYETTIELMTSIHQLVGNHLMMITKDAYKNDDDIKIAITANESDLVPEGLKVIDVGYRPVDIVTILKIAEYLDLPLDVVKSAMKKVDYLRTSRNHSVENQLKRYQKVQELSSMIARKSEIAGFVAKYTFDDILYRSLTMENCVTKAKKVAEHDINVLLYGETGTGKELFAQSIHRLSSRRSFPFVAVNVTAIPQHLIESEMFGYSEGAFTGAIRGGKKGLVEYCDGGTLFLDEIGDMSLDFQAKLLRVLQEGVIMPVGSNKMINVNVRILAATNKDILSLVNQGKFREDLYYRLKAAVINIPPLRERRQDLRLYINEFLPNYQLSKDVVNALEDYSWRGNVRELKQACEYIKIMAEGNVELSDLPDDIQDTLRHDSKNHLNMMEDKPKWILEAIYDLSLNGHSSGRLSIVSWNSDKGRNILESEVKRGLKWLRDHDYIVQHKGRKGSVITEKGRYLLD